METNEQRLATFYGISVLLTGFNPTELWGTGMVEPYFNVVMNQNPIPVVDAFLDTAKAIMDRFGDNYEKAHDPIAELLMPDSLYDGLARNIITLWYMGNWGNEMVSAQSYVQGLVWDAAYAHPPGAKQPGYGSWHNPPLNAPMPTPATQTKKKKVMPLEGANH